MKKANPSAEKGSPMMPPASAMKRGQSSPSSNERTVPETAPTAKRMANPLAQRPRQRQVDRVAGAQPEPLGDEQQTGNPMPSAAKTM